MHPRVGCCPLMEILTNWQSLHPSMSDARVLVTGGAGFIGSHLADALLTLGAQVIVIDDLSGGSRNNISPGVGFVQGSITDYTTLVRAMRGCRYVFHHAALGSVSRSIEEPRLYNLVNITGTLNVLEAARETRVQRVVFAASSSAYGASEELPKVETMPLAPLSPYAATKAACEAMMMAYAGSYAPDTVCLRYFNIFGPRQNANSAHAAAIAAFATAYVKGQRPFINGDGEQSRDFTYVDNAVHANLLAVRNTGRLNGVPINIACGRQVTVNQLAKGIRELTRHPDLLPEHGPDRAGDVRHSAADLRRAEQLLGYKPIVDFDNGLRATVEWYASSVIAGT